MSSSLAGIEQVDKLLLGTKSFAAFDAHYAELPMRECPQKFRSRDYYRCLVCWNCSDVD